MKTILTLLLLFPTLLFGQYVYPVVYEVQNNYTMDSSWVFENSSDVYAKEYYIDCNDCPATIVLEDNVIVRFFGGVILGNRRFILGENSEVILFLPGLENPHLSIKNIDLKEENCK